MIMNLLKERLVFREGQYWWPDWMRSALVWWSPILPRRYAPHFKGQGDHGSIRKLEKDINSLLAKANRDFDLLIPKKKS